ncbi:hypothetical protein H310_12706 [Aphanomyces invadans]|uniref:CAAX prenyl protease 2/Lysostaphin resistance protein A-like domain-containing protein n=1 Tax=Aphanomyces invadans TaxID=157072 RepID=A0A024TI63_9STRA|nr:hypothetical protein H310_12706 [Aphanomyces invadans]ETV93276.1 hypothetical protein H310_12706 [Aphanomyces invadans]|eukprot:XP_008878113.1 hypothetical protein H310_12706 [Aphanomyces invadans]
MQLDAPDNHAGAAEAHGDAHALLPPVDVLENGLIALIAPTEGSSLVHCEGARRKLQDSLLAAAVAWVELIAFMGETFFAMILSLVCRSCAAAAIQVVLSTSTTSSVCESLWDATFVCLYVLRRSASNFHQPSLRAWIRRLGLYPFSLSSLAIAWIVYQVVGFLAVWSYQRHTNEWIWSWGNYYSVDGTSATHELQRSHILEILVLSPIKEELVFRGVAFHVLSNRCASGSRPIPSSSRSCRVPNHPKAAALCVSIVFGCTHLVNLMHAKFSVLYVAIQTCLGVQIGFFYGLQYLHTGSLFQVIVLHIVNNLLSSFTSTQMDITASALLQFLRTCDCEPGICRESQTAP